ncbi:FAD-dependent oxidoreductase [Porticoccaceae bacterium LTM1]|nr:FAD-dependent oxidoreductase [Porticoccaceae bacterium LTM1]
MEQKSDEDFDITIIGGGIQGAGIAQAAAAAGYRTLLVEKTDWAAGTSSKSSKLIHGGLRYLEHGQWSLVRESIRERELLIKLAPELVQRNDFFIPLYKNSRLSSTQLRCGLWVYQLLSGFKSSSRFEQLKPEDKPFFSQLNSDGLHSIFRYSDAQTDDQALTRAVVQSASDLGVTLTCPAEMLHAEANSSGYNLQIRHKGKTLSLHCQVLINACGPWVNHLLRSISPMPRRIEIELVQGTHIFFEEQLSPYCFYLEAPQDGRAVFVMPWKNGTLVGTTETLYLGHPDHCHPLDSEVDYLQTVLNHYFPNWIKTPNDAFCGLRVLPKALGSDQRIFSRSREVIVKAEGHYIGVYGGKLTGYRATAEKIIKQVREIIGRRQEVARTDKLTLKSSDLPPQSSLHTSAHSDR